MYLSELFSVRQPLGSESVQMPGERQGRRKATGEGEAPHPFWMAARGSLLLRTQIMSRVKRKKKAAVAKHIR